MFRRVRGGHGRPILDLSSRRAALASFRNDAAEVLGPAGVTAALDKVLIEIDRNATPRQTSTSGGLRRPVTG
jgi:hypothetical protein